eukprot:3925390-Rhodomonas_salina.1
MSARVTEGALPTVRARLERMLLSGAPLPPCVSVCLSLSLSVSVCVCVCVCVCVLLACSLPVSVSVCVLCAVCARLERMLLAGSLLPPSLARSLPPSPPSPLPLPLLLPLSLCLRSLCGARAARAHAPLWFAPASL